MNKPTAHRTLRVLALAAMVAAVGGVLPVAASASEEPDAAPVCNEIHEGVFRDEPLSWNVGDLCTDPEGGTVYVTQVRVPALGTVSANWTTIGYDSPDGLYGYGDEFTYLVTDGVNETQGYIHVHHYHPGIGTAVADSFTLKAGESITFDVRDNDLNAETNGVWVHGTTLGELVQHEDESFTYTAPYGFIGDDTTSYTLNFAGYGGPDQVALTFTITA